MDQCYSSRLQLSFIWIIKENTSLRCEGMLTQKPRKEEQGWGGGERDPQPFDSSCYMIFLLPLSLPYVNWANKEDCLFHLRFSLQSSELPLLYFLRAFSCFVFWPLPFWTPFSYSNYLIFLTQEAQFFENSNVEVFLATSCWAGTARGIGPPLLASLKP